MVTAGEMTEECSSGKDLTDRNLDVENNRHTTCCAVFPVPRYLTDHLSRLRQGLSAASLQPCVMF